MVFDGYLPLVKPVLALLLMCLLVAWWLQKPHNLPPGPWRFPVIGFLPQLMWSMYYKQEGLHLFLTRLGQKYGKIYSVDVFGHVIVVINDFTIMKEANNIPTLCNKGFNNELECKMFGSIFHSYKHMAEYRKFALKTFRGLGIGKSSFESNIVEEFRALSEELDALKGNTCNPHDFFVNCVSNVLFAVIFGKRHDYDDENFRHYTDLNNRLIELLGDELCSVFFPHNYPNNMNKNTKEVFIIMQELYAFIDTLIDEHRQDFDAENPKDFIDVYFKAIDDSPKPDDPYSYLQKDNMRASLYTLFLGGADLPATILDWCCLFMLAYPDVQEKIQEELDSVVGRNRSPQLSDQAKMPFTKAVLLEVQRHVTLQPLSDFHAASADVTFRGYNIPKGATVISNLYGVTRDPVTFPEPDRFMPERFINDAGEYVNMEEVCPFGIGRRNCIGEHLATMEIFIIFTHLLHRYSLVKANDSPPTTLERNHAAAIMTPKPFMSKFVIRE